MAIDEEQTENKTKKFLLEDNSRIILMIKFVFVLSIIVTLITSIAGVYEYKPILFAFFMLIVLSLAVGCITVVQIIKYAESCHTEDKVFNISNERIAIILGELLGLTLATSIFCIISIILASSIYGIKTLFGI